MQYISFLADLAVQAGNKARAMHTAMDDSKVATKETERDIVTIADRATEELIRNAVKQKFPEHRFYGEETGRSENEDSPYCWIVDPIDGTVSYFQGQLYWCTSIALWKENQPIAAAVYAPMLDELYYAEVGCGTLLNGRPAHVKSHGKISTSVMATGFSCLRSGWTEGNNMKYVEYFGLHSRGVRRFGSAAMDMCYVACGKTDGFWELNLQPYDVAAGVLLVQEAGGMVSAMDGSQDYPRQGILATNGTIHQEMLQVFQGYTRPQGR